MIRRPPRSTLFPTRRSSDLIRSVANWPEAAKLHETAVGIAVLGLEKGFEAPGFAVVSEQDRKSTRLNSSHMSISYAVFCLKKKNSILLTHTDVVTTAAPRSP